ncbi:cation diffusion facilitator family transporter [Pseudolysinimonas sp.]|jgi:cation diffusion facilitator family transporter|uniref:cation diffusion facilitator family transporter n=1 Tax=Pseudolysinimonas sp. TaxID=2680009 RepID=UPI003784E844
MPPAHEHEHDGHGHGREHEHEHEAHRHPTGPRGFLHRLFAPHSHDAADQIDDALESNRRGIRALKISLIVLGATALLQIGVVVVSGSVALLADTIHNFSDALTAVPLWVAFALGRRAVTRRYTHGFGRAEDLAGLFIVAMIALSAIVAGAESIRRFFDPQPVQNLWWVLSAGLIGFAGNEFVALYRIRVGRRIGSAALVADGVHARADGFTSLAVVGGAVGVMFGFPLADPLVGLLISLAIFILLVGTVRSIGRRLMDGVEPEKVDRLESALGGSRGVLGVSEIRLRWVGHRLHGSARLSVASGSLSAAEEVVHDAEHAARRALPHLDRLELRPHTPVRSSPAALASSKPR